ncbi:Ig-like domain-containing protein [Herbiconiux sp. P17]|uniref:Ig-like domain-containing protein n=1 Tax=Herbiconiux wuyangfengii TaxID=3342794 RepID=UPI0035B9965F
MVAHIRLRTSRRLLIGLGAAVLVAAGVFSGTAAAQAADLADPPSPTTTTIVTTTALTFGDPVSMTVSVEQAGGTPAQGTIQLLVGGNGFGSGYPLVGGSVTITLESTGSEGSKPVLLSPGTWAIEADFVPDDAALQEPSSASVDIDVAQGPTEVNFTVSPVSAAFGQEIYLSANVSHFTLVDPTGTFSFYQDGVLVGTAALHDFGYASLRFTPAASGSSTITAVYSGDVSFAGSSSAGTVLTVADPPAVTTPADTGSAPDPGARLADTGTDALSMLAGAGALTLLGGLAFTASAVRSRA